MARRARRRSFGSVTEMVRGKKYVIRWVQNTPDGRKRKSKTIYGTYREACRELALREVEHGGERALPTWGDVYRVWYLPKLRRRVEAGSLSEGTVKLYLGSWSRHLGPFLAARPVDGVSPLEMQDWLLTLSKPVAQTAVCVMSQMSRLALSYTGANALFGNGQRYEIPEAANRRSSRVLTLAEASSLLSRLEGSPVEARFILACYGGLRTGEALAVRSEDVELFGGYAAVTVDKQMPATGTAPTRRLKNRQSERVAVVAPPASLRIAHLCSESESGWLSDRGDGLPSDKSRHLSLWNGELERVGEAPIPFSNLRNSWRTIAETEMRVPWDLCEMLMGHKLPGVTGAHYVRQSRSQVVAMAAKELGTWDI